LELTISLPEDADPVAVLGSAERNIKVIREVMGISISARNGALRLIGESKSVNRAAAILAELADAARRRRPMSRDTLLERIQHVTMRDLDPGPNGRAGNGTPEVGLDVYVRGRRVDAMTPGQALYLEAIAAHDLVFCSGPAGTGKTYLAVAAAVTMLKRSEVRKLVLVRPAVEAGERLGFLPGDLQEKVNPYLRPLFDALHDMMSFEQVQRYIQSDIIEIVPLAFMRGRTLNDAAIILDEAQNTTVNQMLMFLTRMGNGSKMIVTGDTSQIDLDNETESGLIDAARRLHKVPGIAFLTLGRQDIVRHDLVQKIVLAYGKDAAHDGPHKSGEISH
jgi:phosphate starvation-inducible PhoH-like protein